MFFDWIAGYYSVNDASLKNSRQQFFQMISTSNEYKEKPNNLITVNGCTISSLEGRSERIREILCVVVGKVRKKSDIRAKKELGNADLGNIIEDYNNQGPSFLSNYSGHFLIFIADKKNNCILMATDRIGTKSLYYSLQQNGNILFSSRLTTLRSHPAIDARIDHQSIYNYIYYHMIPSPGSIYSGIEKLGPSEYLLFKDGKKTINQYWEPVFSEKSYASEKEMYADLHETLRMSVELESSKSQHIGAFLSGGLDSSTIAGKVAELSDNAETYTIGFDLKKFDETPYARLAAKHFKCNHHEYFVTPSDVVEALPVIVSQLDEPFGNSSVLPTYFCARMAKENGVDILFAGDGGDELFAGNERYAKQKIFESYIQIPELLRQTLVEWPIRLLGNTDHLKLIRKANNFLQYANTPLPDRLQNYNFLNRHQYSEVFEQEFLDSIDTAQPLELFRDRFRIPEDASTLNRMLFLDWKFTLADNDLRKVTNMCNLSDVRVAYPMISDEVIELSCNIPSSRKLKGRQLRYFYKKAMQKYLPDEILNKEKHGFGLPFGYWLRDDKGLQSMAYDSVSKLQSRNIFKAVFLNQVIDLHRSVHSGFYGELIWILMILELWLEYHTD